MPGQWYTHLGAKDVVDTTATPLRYRYDDERPTPVRVVPQAARRQLEAAVRRGPPEKLGATLREVPLGPSPTHAEIEIAAPEAAGLESFAGGRQPGRAFLVLGNVRGRTVSAGSFDVYLNAPEDASPRQRDSYKAGTISMFGVVESSTSDERHARLQTGKQDREHQRPWLRVARVGSSPSPPGYPRRMRPAV